MSSQIELNLKSTVRIVCGSLLLLFGGPPPPWLWKVDCLPCSPLPHLASD